MSELTPDHQPPGDLPDAYKCLHEPSQTQEEPHMVTQSITFWGGFLSTDPLPGRRAGGQCGRPAELRVLVPWTLGPHVTLPIRRNRTGGSMCGFQPERPGNPRAWVFSSTWVSVVQVA